jgi:dTDP-4-dehydrorhamnose 3,5-epimerase
MPPELIRGDLAIDDRGEVTFVNGLSLDPVRRFYVVRNYRRGMVRAWHAHRKEEKWATVVRGAALVCCVELDNWDDPSPSLEVHRFVLARRKPAVLHIPAGYANGFMSLTRDATLLFFSSVTHEASVEDDVRYPARFWDPWSVEER